MKIVHIITRLILGGAQENTLITCSELAKRGHDVTLITGPALGPEGELFNQTENGNYKVITIPRLIRPIRPVNDLLCYRQLCRILQAIKPDIVHTHSAKAGIVGRYAASSIKPRPKIVHGVHGLSFHQYQNAMTNKFYIAIERAAAKKTDFFITVADAMTSQSLAVGIGRPAQYTTAYSAIEEDAFLTPVSEQDKKNFRRKYDIADDAVVLVTVARLFSLKGHDYIIESSKTLSKSFPKAVWLFVGDGILADKFKKQVAACGLDDKIKFTGLLATNKIPLALQSSDILVHCSLREGLARAIPQAMLCSKPAVAFDLDGSKEVINPKTGRLVKPQDVGDLIDKCAELLADANLRQTLGTNAQQSVKEKFSPKAMTDVIENVYKTLTAF